MKVKRMIEELKKFNPEADVQMHMYGGESVLFVLARANDNDTVWLETETDCDLGNELAERFEHLPSDEEGQIDFYKDLFEIGITLGVIYKYLGTDAGKHIEDFCTNHHLI